MKYKITLAISVLALLSPICLTVMMLFLEPEFVEAVLAGLFIGCIVGSVLGGVSLYINKGNSKLIKIFSITPMFLLMLYLLLLLP